MLQTEEALSKGGKSTVLETRRPGFLAGLCQEPSVWLGESFVPSPIKGKGGTKINISQIVGIGFLRSASSMRFLKFLCSYHQWLFFF